MASEEFCYLAPDRLKPSRRNPRKTFDPASLVELKESIRRDGIITPLIVRPIFADAKMNGEGSGAHHFEILAGERRFRMAVELELKEVPVRIRRDLSDDQALELMIVENLLREDVHELEEAEGFKALLAADEKQDVESLAARCGKSASYVYQRLKLCELIAPAKKAFLEGAITAGHAIEIARLTAADQKQALAACFQRDWDREKKANVTVMASVRELRRWIASEIHLDLSLAAFPKDEPNLYKEAGACSVCPKNTGVAKELFADSPRNHCTDRKCFMRKGLAFERSMREQLTSAKTGFVEVTDRDYRPYGEKPPAGVLKAHDYEKVGAVRCESTVKGLLVGEIAGRGTILNVCTDRKCKKHLGKYGTGGAATRGQTEAQKREAKLEQLKRKATETARQKTLELVVKKAAADPKGSLLIVADQLAINTEEAIEQVYQAHGWPQPKNNKIGMSDYSADLIERLGKLSEREILTALVEIALADEVSRGRYYDDDSDPLIEAAKRFKIQPVKPEPVSLPKVEKTGKKKLQTSAKPAVAKPSKKKAAASIKRARAGNGLTAAGKRNLEALEKRLAAGEKGIPKIPDSTTTRHATRAAEAST